MKALKELAPRNPLPAGAAMKLRHVPELHFHYDDSVDKGERIENLLRDLQPRRRTKTPLRRASWPHRL